MPKKTYTDQLDTSGHLCPMPVLLVRKKLENMSRGEILQMVATDPATIRDIPSFCTMAKHSLVIAYQEADKYFFNIQKGGKE